jgi:hypothetical protein
MGAGKIERQYLGPLSNHGDAELRHDQGSIGRNLLHADFDVA